MKYLLYTIIFLSILNIIFSFYDNSQEKRENYYYYNTSACTSDGECVSGHCCDGNCQASCR